MLEFDPVALFTNVSPAMAFGILAFWFNRRDHADMLRREQAFSAQLASIVQQQLTDSEKRTEALTLLERRIHDQNNILLRLEARLDPRLQNSREHKGDEAT